MKILSKYLIAVLLIVIVLPTVVVESFSFAPRGMELKASLRGEEIKEKEKPKQEVLSSKIDKIEVKTIKLYNPFDGNTSEYDIEDYVVGVVAAEMPAEFHIEALKAQAVAARTYAVKRTLTYEDGHDAHPDAPICKDVHCQAHLSLEELGKIHGDGWIEKYLDKIQEAVEGTKGLMIYYKGELAEPLYHSTSGGMTEDAVNVFASDTPYLKSVESPYEEGSPRFKTITTIPSEDFISKIKARYPNVDINKDNFFEKIKLIDRSPSGRIITLAIDKEIIHGRELRDIFKLNSTNFTIKYNEKLNIVDIETLGFGHGVGMSQWGANGMAKEGSDFIEILTHYYRGTEIR